MAKQRSRLTSQGQVSVPAEVRRQLGVAPGSVLEWEADGDSVVVRRVGRFSSEDIHKAIFETAPSMKTLGELRDGVRRAVRKRHARD